MIRLSVTHISFLVGLCYLLPANLYAGEATSREYKIKAAYLYNLIKFVSWPPAARTQMNADKHTFICVFGHNPFATELEKLASRKAGGRGINIKYITPQDPPQPCNIVFISKQNTEEVQLLNKSRSLDPSALVVGETASFVSEGGIVSLVVEDNNVQLQINLTQAKKTGFEISGNLLEIAKVVQ